jgi:serine/threonine-protein kinase
MRRALKSLRDWVARSGTRAAHARRPGDGADTQPEPLDTQPPYATVDPLARYRLQRELARGAMGTVHEAVDVSSGRVVALKLMALSRGADPESLADQRERFQRESMAARRLHHPGIAEVYDAGDDGQHLWLAMELVRGRDLTIYTDPGRLLPVAQILRIGAAVARSLAYAHRQGVVHRDIKPANVIHDPASGSTKVADFGVAHLADATRTRTGLVLGTPSYMPPEQIAGRKVDGRADLYALGVMLFQLLIGALPFAQPSMGALLAAIAQQPAPDIRSLRPELPEALAQVVALALQKRPELRYADGDQMAADLETILATGLL